MKTATVREVQHDLKRVLAWVEAGEVSEVTRRSRVVARLVPAEAAAPESPDFVGRARAIWGDRPKGAAERPRLQGARRAVIYLDTGCLL